MGEKALGACRSLKQKWKWGAIFEGTAKNSIDRSDEKEEGKKEVGDSWGQKPKGVPQVENNTPNRAIWPTPEEEKDSTREKISGALTQEKKRQYW